MSCECCQPKSNIKTNICPSCKSEGEVVKRKTILSLLKEDNNLCLKDEDYYYCENQICNTVYFAKSQTFIKNDLKISVDDKFCFCFDISKEEVKQKGKEEVLKKITYNMKSIGCNCDTKNPSGRCCKSQIEKNY